MTLRLSAFALACFFFFLLGCGTIMHGSRQDVGISSTPSGAKVTIDNVENGKTPVVAKLTRKDNHIVKIELDGFHPYEATLTKSVTGWAWGNILFGGIIGLAVDAISGGLYNLTPEQVQATMANKDQKAQVDGDILYIAVVMRPDPSWRKIGQISRVAN